MTPPGTRGRPAPLSPLQPDDGLDVVRLREHVHGDHLTHGEAGFHTRPHVARQRGGIARDVGEDPRSSRRERADDGGIETRAGRVHDDSVEAAEVGYLARGVSADDLGPCAGVLEVAAKVAGQE